MRADAARREAVVIIDRIQRGEDPVPPEPVSEPTVAELAERYMHVHVEVDCRPKTVDTFGRVVRLHIVPELGQPRAREPDGVGALRPGRGAAGLGVRTRSCAPRSLWVCGQLLRSSLLPTGSTTTGEFKIFDPAFRAPKTGNSNCRRRKIQLTLTTRRRTGPATDQGLEFHAGNPLPSLFAHGQE